MYDRDTAETWGRKVREAPETARLELATHLRAHAGNIRAVAKALGCGRVTLYRWLALLGMSEAPELARTGARMPWLEPSGKSGGADTKKSRAKR